MLCDKEIMKLMLLICVCTIFLLCCAGNRGIFNYNNRIDFISYYSWNPD